MNIRIATPEDAFAIQNIYRYYVDNTAKLLNWKFLR